MTFDEAFEAHMGEVDRCYGELRNLLADPNYLNRKHDAYVRASDHLRDAINAVFALKETWMASRYLQGESLG